MYHLIRFQLPNPEQHPPVQLRNARMILHKRPHKDRHSSGRHFCRPPTDGAINLWAWTRSFSIWQRQQQHHQQQQQQQHLFRSHTLLHCLLSLMCEACSNIRLHKHRCQRLKGWEQQNNNASLWGAAQTDVDGSPWHDKKSVWSFPWLGSDNVHCPCVSCSEWRFSPAQCSFHKLVNMNLMNCEAGCSRWDKNRLGVTSKEQNILFQLKQQRKMN